MRPPQSGFVQVGLWNVIGTRRTQTTSSQTAIGKNVLSEAIHEAKKIRMRCTRCSLKTFKRGPWGFPWEQAFASWGVDESVFDRSGKAG